MNLSRIIRLENMMEYKSSVLDVIYTSVEQVNAMTDPGKAIAKSPDAVVMGARSTVDSLTFVNLAAALEENIEQVFKEKISLIDLIFSGKKREWTLADLAAAISLQVNHTPVVQQATDVRG